jgi:hypothetical protein
MKKLTYPFAEIEVPDDFPETTDFNVLWQYAEIHPEVAERVRCEYRSAYRKWVNGKKKRDVSTTLASVATKA